MTLSNFDWTDKDSVKWFILGPLGHIGPYSLNQLEQMVKSKKLASEVKVWAEGLTDAVFLENAIQRAQAVKEDVELDTPPDLPPIPTEEIPPFPTETPEVPVDDENPVEEGEESDDSVSPRKIPLWAFFTFGLFLLCVFAFNAFVSSQEEFEISRRPKMSMELHERIKAENTFAGWDKNIFFKEYLPDDHSHIWLVNSGFQDCDVEAEFKSLEGKLLTMQDESVSFRTRGELRNHLVEFSELDFSQGNKIIPGLYEMDIKATKCKWNGLAAKIMNKFQDPDKEYLARTKVILFSKGAVEFNSVLEKLVQKKMEIELRAQAENDLFWGDLQQKLETLQAITLQIEQHMLDFLQADAKNFRKNVKPMVDEYTRKFGSFLTSFVVENENYFNDLKYEGKGSSEKRNYELMVRLTAKKIGLESMKFIEEFQSVKSTPKASGLKSYQERVKDTYAGIKLDIGQKIIQVSEDRSK